ncbi:YidH family protein [Actinomycetospora sp. CA-084318]|uniref:YidH family protein n=1 Tax=Actinomycetospora sp. CA-084318 TaxID=3239892 RepID=UPI003D99BD26
MPEAGAASPQEEHAGGPDDEREPDYRFTLANERTFLAWLRTSLSLLAAGVAVVQLVPAFTIPGARAVTGGLLAALAVVAAASGVLRWRSVETAIRRDRPLPAQRIPWVLAAGLVVLALFGFVLIVLRGAT